METNAEVIRIERTKKMQFSYALVVVCLSDWLYQLFQWVTELDLTGLLGYFAYLSQLWQSNTIITIAIMVMCLFGLPKLISSLQNSLNVVGRLLRSIMRTPIIVNVPISLYLFVFIAKYYLFFLNLIDSPDLPAVQSSKSPTYWKTIRQNLTNHRYSSLFTLVLFLLGLYTIATNRWTKRLAKRALSLVNQQMKFLQKILFVTIPTPMSLLMLVVLNSMIQFFPNVAMGVYRTISTRSAIGSLVALLCSYQIYRWLWPTVNLDVDLTGNIHLNDVSRLNATRIHSLFYPRTLNDIEYLVYKARSQGKTISLRGQAHTMGGQTLPSRSSSSTNYVCDLKYLNRVIYDESSKDVLVEAGATWTHVIKKLNSYGRSPVIMQSYCTFSVAGTISVNAHGITSDDAMYESVVGIEYIDMNGQRGECNREKQPELFSLMIGGYGLFGIITRLRLKTVPNVKTALEYIRLQSDQFSTFYENFLDDPSIEIKIARVDLTRPNNVLMFIFRQQLGTHGTIADLTDEARVMHPRQHLIYTYLAQHRLFRRVRFALEKAVARPLDLTFSTDRNTTMYESAKPMALLYQPLTYYDDTFVLQEYFIPKENFHHWYTKLVPVIQRKYAHIFLLNLTIRFVKKDTLTYLAYTKQADCYAFVFYFRIARNERGDGEVRDVHQQLIQLAFECHGTFYLPYRQHYSYEQISRAYPMFDEFLQKKHTYDPVGLFSNDWYDHYRPKREEEESSRSCNEVKLITEPFEVVEERRTDSFFQVISNEILREKFRKFLRTVFRAEPVHVVFNYVNRAVRNPSNTNDNEIYRELQNALKTRQFASIRGLFAVLRQIQQLRIQIRDMLRQQITIFKHLGYCGKIKDIVSIGDGGRCIGDLRQILKIKNGRVYIINDRERLTNIIERNSLFPIGTFVPYNFTNITDVPIPSHSIDLVVCYMGLHHLPQDQLQTFLAMVHRILRPNGLFLFREHHAYEELKPLLDVAHMVFNAVTGVDYPSEVKEIRAFRTVEQWRSCLRQAGFEDTFVYDEQEDDPTDDIMIVGRKPAEPPLISDDLQTIIERENFQTISAHLESNYFRACEWLVVRIVMQYGQYLNHTPFYYFPYVKFILTFWSLCWTETRFAVEKFGWKTALTASPGFFMNLVVGTFLTVAFVQLAVFSFLCRSIAGVREKPEYEQLILQQIDDEQDEFDFQTMIDSQIDHVERSERNRLYSLRVPRHHVFTGVIKKLSLYQTKFNLHSVSQQTEAIQLELAVLNNNRKRLLWLKQRPNLDLIYEFVNPVDRNEMHVIVRVPIKHLLSFVRECVQWEEEQSLRIVQIYDHFD